MSNDEQDPVSAEKAAVLQSMQANSDEFTTRSLRTRRAYRDRQHQGYVSELAQIARKQFDELAGEQGESDDGDDTREEDSAGERSPRTESNGGGTPRN